MSARILVATCRICQRQISKLDARGETWRHNQSSVLDHDATPVRSTVRDLMAARSS